MFRAVSFVLAAVTVTQACVPTQVITTTTTVTPCCSPLTINSMPKVAPQGVVNYEQCSVLRRISSTCPKSGWFLCSAAPETNPASVLVQALNGVTEVSKAEDSSRNGQATLQIFCVDGLWKGDPTGDGLEITSVSCSQTGSVGTDIQNANAWH